MSHTNLQANGERGFGSICLAFGLVEGNICKGVYAATLACRKRERERYTYIYLINFYVHIRQQFAKVKLRRAWEGKC